MAPRKTQKRARKATRTAKPLPAARAKLAHKEVIEVDGNGDRLYRLPDAAERLAMAVNTLKERIRSGAIKACFVGNASDKSPNRKGVRISEAELQRYISANEYRVAPSA